MSVFTEAESAYLSEQRLARLATVSPNGTPHVTPVMTWSVHDDNGAQVIHIGGYDFDSSKKFRDVSRTGRAAIVIDDLVSKRPWHPRGIEVRGRAEAVNGSEPHIRLYPERIVGWGFDDSEEANARTV